MAEEYIPVECAVLHMTKKAVLVAPAEDPEQQVWVPLSVIFEDDLAELEVGVFVEINVAAWFASKEGL